MALFMIRKALKLVQVYITLLFIFFNLGDVKPNDQDIGRLTFLAFLQIRVLFSRLIRGLAGLI